MDKLDKDALEKAAAAVAAYMYPHLAKRLLSEGFSDGPPHPKDFREMSQAAITTYLSALPKDGLAGRLLDEIIADLESHLEGLMTACVEKDDHRELKVRVHDIITVVAALRSAAASLMPAPRDVVEPTIKCPKCGRVDQADQLCNAAIGQPSIGCAHAPLPAGYTITKENGKP
jgi:hypothetical protein